MQIVQIVQIILRPSYHCMKTTLKLILIFTLFIGKTFAQSSEVEGLVDRGISLYDKGDYKGAIEQYQKALAIDSKSAIANYEISNTYFTMGEYKNALIYCERVLSEKSDFKVQAYILKGSALDLLDITTDAIKTYKKGIKEFPENYLLHYNLALTYYKTKELKSAEESLQKSVVLKPLHSSSHLLLGYVMNEQGQRIKSLLALYNFLLIEPSSKRAKSAYNLLVRHLEKGVEKENDHTINITLPATKESDDFGSAELMLSLLTAANTTEKNKDKTANELFADNTSSFFSFLASMKKNNKGFWWDYYVDFYSEMYNEKHVEAFSYYISQSKEDEAINKWFVDNKAKVDALSNWVLGYKR